MNQEHSRIISDAGSLRELLDEVAERINCPGFIPNDPVRFPRMFGRKEDIEITALLSALLAWGNRTMIRRDITRLLEEMEYAPYDYLRERGFEAFPDDRNIHRTFFGRDFRYLMRGLNEVYSRFGSLEGLLVESGAAETETPAWDFTEALRKILMDRNAGAGNSRCLPSNISRTALKRINMAFRWLVRDDGIVDIGLWKGIPKSKLYIPLDVHVGNTARNLGLLERKSNDRNAVVQLTEELRRFRPDDPTIYDFALFGLGVADPVSSGNEGE